MNGRPFIVSETARLSSASPLSIPRTAREWGRELQSQGGPGRTPLHRCLSLMKQWNLHANQNLLWTSGFCSSVIDVEHIADKEHGAGKHSREKQWPHDAWVAVDIKTCMNQYRQGVTQQKTNPHSPVGGDQVCSLIKAGQPFSVL